MKIAYLMQAGVPDLRERSLSGPALHVKHVVDELRKSGHDVRVLAQLDKRIWKADDLNQFEPVEVRHIDNGPFRILERGVRRVQFELKLPYAALFESVRFARACRQELDGFDVLYERMGWFGYGGALASRWLGIPLILEVNGDHLNELEMQGMAPRGMQRRLSMALMKRTALSAAHTVATGEGWRRRHTAYWAVGPEKISVVENGSELVSLLSRHQLRSFCDSDANAPTTVAYSGGFDPWQGVTVLLYAISQVIRRGTLVHLLLLGSGSEMQDARGLAQELGIASHVTFTGRLAGAEYAEKMAQADIGVAPYCGRDEFSGLKLLDYKAAGLATIASGRNGEPAVIIDGKTGRIVPPCDENALCDAIATLCFRVETRKQMGRTARVEAEQFHSWANTAERLNELFTRVVRQDKAARIGAKRNGAFEPV